MRGTIFWWETLFLDGQNGRKYRKTRFAEDWIGAKKSHFFTVFLAPKEHRSRECEFVKRLGMLATSSPEFGFEKKERHFAFCCGRRKPKIF